MTMNMKLPLALAATLSLFLSNTVINTSASAHPSMDTSVFDTSSWFMPSDRGGKIIDYLVQVDAAREMHHIDGYCLSACTLWLGAKKVCVTERAVLGFHSASDDRVAIRGGNPWLAMNEGGNEVLRSYYKRFPRVARRVGPALRTPQLQEVSGSELIALG
eukprot:gene36590-43603_t